MIYRPSKFFGFLNFIPRAGIRETYFSKTRRTEYYDVTVTETNELGFATNSTFEASRDVEAGSGLRSLPELGLEVSYKAFSTWGRPGSEVRHVVQPYIDYTFIPEPSLEEEDLYQFDNVDELGQTHEVQIGARNKYQVKRGDKASDILDVNVYTFYKIYREDGEDAITHVYFDAELDPFDDFKIQSDGVYSLEDSGFEKLNVELAYEYDDNIDVNLEYRYVNREEVSRLISADTTFLKKRPWSFNVFGRYEMEEKRLEEQGGYIQRNYDCLSLRTGYSILPGYENSDGTTVEDEWRVQIEFWLSAFPNVGVRMKPRYSR